MKRNTIFAAAVLTALLLMILTGCACRHKWQAATCTDPEVCEKCGATQGEALGHDWQDATCTTARYCERCGLTQGDPLGHSWAPATCTEPETCLTCGAAQGEALGHTWVDATCTGPKTCSVCGAAEGDPLGHTVEEWTEEIAQTCGQDGLRSGVCTVCGETVEETLPATGEHSWDDGTTELAPTCTEDGTMLYTCTVCGEQREEAIPATGHTSGDWVVTEEAQSDAPGVRVQYCSVCGEELKTEEYNLSAEELADAFRAECTTYDYETVARQPDSYIGEKVHFRGEVIQSMEDGDDYILRVDVTNTGYYWTDTIYVEYTKNDSSEARILEDDIVDLYGYFAGTITYETVMGNDMTIPAMLATYIDIN